MSVGYPIFPGFAPGHGWGIPPAPLRSPTWNYKVSKRFMNYPQVSVNGITTITKYWSNPLRNFEWKYQYIVDDPTNHNLFYAPYPIPSTDFEMLDGFYTGMQASGNQFAYTPPGYQVGGTWPVTAVSSAGTVVTCTATGAGTALASSVGHSVFAANTLLGSINNQWLEVLSVSGPNTVTLLSPVSAVASEGSGGILSLGSTLANPDSNGNTELVVMTGSYPNITNAAFAGTVVPVVESVQLIDTATLVVYDSTGTNLTGTWNLLPPNSQTPPGAYIPYVGYVVQFSTLPTHFPLTAQFSMYYICRFSEDTQEYENFLAMLWLSTVKFQQDRI